MAALPLQDIDSMRGTLRERRRRLDARTQVQHAHSLSQHLQALLFSVRYQRIAAYLPVAGEINVLPFLAWLWQQGRQVFLPQLARTTGRRLRFVSCDPGDALMLNRCRVLQPTGGRPIGLQRLDAIVVPMLGFDARHNRLGMGGGYYDVTLGRSWCRPILIGVAHQCQGLPVWQPQPWDVRMDCVITEQGSVV